MQNNENNYKEAEREEIKKQEESYALAKKKIGKGSFINGVHKKYLKF